jgi:Cof subfamily protein (haloacid dehalogenase superfamily)
MSKQKIVFLDIDGTLASRVTHVPASAKRACRTARENGHLLYIASGRAKIQIPPKILAIGFDGVISSGGAFIEAGGKPVYGIAFERDMLERLLGYLDGHHAPYVLELSEQIVAGPQFYAVLGKLAATLRWASSGFAARAFIRFFKRQTTDFGTGFDRDNVRKVVFLETSGFKFEDARLEFQGACEMFRNSIPVPGMEGGEISPKDTHKGAALEKVLEYHGLAREDSIALGDGDNDRSMLQSAGLGIAMGNADEDLKRIADDVTGAVGHGGLAQAFKKYGLI